MLERLIVLPRENAEVFIKYEANPNLAGQLSGYLNQENLILAQQADGLAKRLPKDQVSAADYSAIAQALLFSRSYQQAILDLKEAVKSAVLLDEKVTALRTLGYVEMNLGQIASGRAHLEQALEIFVEFPGFDDFTVRSTTMQTQVNWTGAELAAGNYNVAVEHMNAAEQAVAPLPPGPGKSLLEAQLKQSRASLAQSQQPNAGSQQPAKPSSLIPPSLSPGAASKL